MKIENLVLGSYYVNTYFLIDEKKKEALIIDPGGDGTQIKSFVEENNINLKMIINTHGHPDHVEANSFLKKEYSLPILINPKDADFFEIPYDKPIVGGDTIKLGNINLKVIDTPGHTYGSVCLLGDGFMFTGDTIFAGSIGRTDLGGDRDLMYKTLATAFVNIPEDTVLYPGHGPSTTLGEEFYSNIYIMEALRMYNQGL